MPRKKQQSDQALLEVIMPIIFGKGPREFTLAEAAAAAGLSKAALLQRFGSKERLVLLALLLINRRNFAALDELPAEKGAEAVIRIFVERTAGPEHEQLLMDQLLWLRESMADTRVNAVSQDYFVKFRRAIAERMPALPIPGDEAARLVEAQWHGAMTQWGIGRAGHLRDYVEGSLRTWFALLGHPTG